VQHRSAARVQAFVDYMAAALMPALQHPQA